MNPNDTSIDDLSNGVYAFVPLPWRVLFLIGFAILCWGSNLHFLHLLHLDTAYVLDMHSPTNLPFSRTYSPSTSAPAHLYSAIYKLFAAYSVWTFACWLLFRVLCAGDVRSMDHYKFIPSMCLFIIIIVSVSPFKAFRRRERQLFLQGLYRCFFSVLNQNVYFSDVLLADILTSLAKVIGDLWLVLLMLMPNGSFLAIPAQEGWLQWIIPLTMCLPYAARLRQCLIEYFTSSAPSNNRALFNALKYSTSFPVIFLSAAQRSVTAELAAEKGPEILHSPWHGEHPLFRFWLLAVVINSGFSFWWDVTNDWGLSMFQPTAENHVQSSLPSSNSNHNHNHKITNNDSYPETKYPPGLRSILLFNDPFVYYMAIGVNLVLRFTWSLKLSSHLHTLADLEGGVFMLEALELIRRWLWVFFRIEWEAVKKGGGSVEHTLVNGDVELNRMLDAHH